MERQLSAVEMRGRGESFSYTSKKSHGFGWLSQPKHEFNRIGIQLTTFSCLGEGGLDMRQNLRNQRFPRNWGSSRLLR